MTGVQTCALPISAAALDQVPVAPATPTATAGDGQVTLSLTSIPGATGYNVYYKAGSSPTTADTKATGSPYTTLSPVISGLTDGFSYSFIVTAQNVTGEGATSSAVSVIPQGTTLLTMLPVAGGSFSNGTGNVTVSSFLMSKFEVTQGQYKIIAGINPSFFTGDLNRPVEKVTWYDAVEFCNKLSTAEGLAPVYAISARNPDSGYPILSATVTAMWANNGYRLPTESEWELAARGGAGSLGYSYAGSNSLSIVAWNSANSGSTTHVPGGLLANELGICDMTGNVWEWCNDWYPGYPAGSQIDPSGPMTGTGRVARGGSWSADIAYDTLSFRTNGPQPATKTSEYGFRPVRNDPAAARIPAGVTATAGASQVSLSWTASTGATTYNVYYAAGTTATTASTKATTAMISGTTATITALTGGTQYAFVVTALNGTNESPASLVATATPAAAGGVPRNGLVAEYLFSGNANDTSGSGNNATAYYAVQAADRFGNVGSAYSFNGTSAYMQTGNYDIATTSTPISYSCWFKADIAGNWYNTLISHAADGSTGPAMIVGNSVFTNRLAVYPGTVGYIYGGYPTVNVWHHAAMTFDGTTTSLYLDGAFNANTAADITSGNRPFLISRWAMSADGYFSGLIDDVRIYNRALGASEVVALYGEGGWGTQAPPSIQILSVANPGAGFTKYGTVALVNRGATGSWDAAWVGSPSVIDDGGTFKMWYCGIDASSMYRIGYATSPDGYAWTKNGTAAVLGPGSTGNFDDAGAWYPCVIKEGLTYKMWYTGMHGSYQSGIGYATSSDGINWTKYASTAVLGLGSGWDASQVGNASVTKVGSTYHMYYTGYSGNDRVGHATSADGISWTKDAANPVFDMDVTDEYGVLSPWVVYDGAAWHMWYTGVSSAWYRIEYASSTTGTGATWTRGTTRPVLSRDGTILWDNFYIYYGCPVIVNGKIWMYYTGEPTSRSPDVIGLAQMLN